ncbi:ribosomal-processing cysteine protease Prp [uncultured Limosilactobacillus sp.]|uniref:ribosomal-processing cysteine protease Prp n=1 Tax=uncultured Limosilactobacillus sp. TaxID=2837629 RepID=UPI0025E4FA55|nr:ribosomal-processing cysteine protease Prp [uncultured Limosilactobacillus sp.]
MIRAEFNVTPDHKIASFKLTGHADAGDYGHDIVCAAVSVLTISTINGLERVVHTKPQVEMNETEGGYINATQLDLRHDSQILLQTFLNGILDIQERYHQYIEVKMYEK